MKNIILLGGGGHAKVVANALLSNKKYNILGYIDKKNNGKLLEKIKYLGNDNKLQEIYTKGTQLAFCAIGSIGDYSIRKNAIEKAKKIGFNFINAKHPTSIISQNVILGEGIYIGPNVIINPETQIGNYCILNTGCIIEHDCEIGEYVHISLGTIIGGGVIIENGSHVGLGSKVIQNIKIGKNAFVCAGAVVVNDIEDNNKVKCFSITSAPNAVAAIGISIPTV